MNCEIIDITSSSDIVVKTAIGTVIIISNEYLKLKNNEVGFLEGKRKHHHQGIFMHGGIINPGWEGYLTIEFLVTGELNIKKNDKVAHAIIMEFDKEVSHSRVISHSRDK